MAGKNKKSPGGAKKNVLLVAMLLTSIAAPPTTVIIFVGMLPTVVARLTDRSRERTRVFTIGFMNFAGCFPFWFKLMQGGHSFELAVNLVTDPFNICIMYGGALSGYMIEWGLSGIVANIMIQKGRNRLEFIKKTQEEMVERWGREVTGDYPLDNFGFPIESKEK